MTFPFLPPDAASPTASASFRYRGLYVESKWGPDLMTLEDWRHLVDEMAALGMNSLGVGVYGCWVVQYDGRRTEFLLVPFPEHPGLETPKTITWYSPAAGAEQTLTYRPRMFDEDFFGQVVAYGRARGVAVRPHFNGPGHTTLIPAVYPEVSARDEAGQPTGYGYCLASERTYELLFGLYDSLIARHLRPNGGVWWHLGLDEVNPYVGVDESDPGRAVDPWCRCPACTAESKTRRLVRFAVRSIEHLVGQGIEQITLWHDALAAVDAYPLFRQEVTARGLQDRVAVQWWRYGDPPLTVGEPALPSWVTPMAGYWSNLFHHDYGANITAMAAEGAAAGSAGLDAYCIYDPAYFRSYALLAALGQRAETRPEDFRAAYATWLFAGQPQPPAFQHFDHLFDSSYGPLGSTLDAFLLYWWTYPAQRHVRYPQDQVAQLAADPFRIGRALGAAQAQAGALAVACRGAAAKAPDARRQGLLREYAAESQKLAGVLAAFRSAAGGWNHHRDARRAATRFESVAALTRAQAAFQTARQATHGVMAELEQTKAPYLRPHILRDLTPLYRWLGQAHDRVRDWRSQVEAGGLDDVPPL